MKILPNPADDPNILINPARGVTDYGVIDAAAAKAIGRPAGPIRLYNGWPGPKGWGHRHITSNERRLTAIRQLGYIVPEAFALEVAANWTHIHSGPFHDRITIGLKMGLLYPALALAWNGACWSITTMLPFRSVSYPVIYEKV